MVLDLVKTAAAVAVPIVVAIIGYLLSQRLKRYDAAQWRNQELIKARLGYFGQLAPMLNDLMCYLTFIGRWKELTPPQVLAIKRDADRLFFSVSPLFSEGATIAYHEFFHLCFRMDNEWGSDAKIRSGYIRRRAAAGTAWDVQWERMFTHLEGNDVQTNEMASVRSGYDKVLAALVEDIELLAPRQGYAPTNVYVNAR